MEKAELNQFFFFLMASDNSVTPVLSAAFARSFLS